eukprot:365293-Chlamydomonas_euryale.AAC.9
MWVTLVFILWDAQAMDATNVRCRHRSPTARHNSPHVTPLMPHDGKISRATSTAHLRGMPGTRARMRKRSSAREEPLQKNVPCHHMCRSCWTARSVPMLR